MNAEADIEISVSTFNDIIIVKNSLVICDIDETLLYYEGIDKKWWSETFYRYYQIHKDYDKADQLCLAEWTSHITSADKYPFFTDRAGYANMIAKINETNSQIVFLTARCEYLRDMTLKHLHHLNIDNPILHFTGGQCKGKYILENILNVNVRANVRANVNSDLRNIIFIDDRLQNIVDVKNKLINFNLTCYLFIMQ